MNDPDEVEKLCDEAEARLQAGLPVTLDEFVRRCEPGRRQQLAVELLLLEIDYSRRGGGHPSRDDFLLRYPDYGPQVEAAFCLVDPDGSGAEEAQAAFAGLGSGNDFSHYRLQQRLGSGATGEVWKAVDRMTGREVALKIPQWSQQSIDQRLRFLREGRALSRLRHPGVVTLYELGRDGALPHLALELVEGGTLRDALRSGPLAPHQAARLCQSLAEALEHAHQRGVLHRDVKPGNILLRPGGDPVLADFGLAKDAQDRGDLTENGDVLGTPAYMAPEQAAGHSSAADARSDVYGAGAALYEALTGVPPTRRIDASAYDGHDPRRLLPNLPRDLAAICHKATQALPDQRYPDARELAADLGRYLDGRPVVARYPSAWRRRLQRLATLRGLVALVVFTAAGVVLGAIATSGTPDNRQQVYLSVEPPESRVAFVPLSEWGGATKPRQVTFASGSGDDAAMLPPGRYYVIAVAPDGRFHEVQRIVPSPGQYVGGPGRYRQVTPLPSGGIALQSIEVPAASVTQTMTLFEGAANYVAGSGEGGANEAGYPIVSFFCDPSAAAWTGAYHEAVDDAEQKGKRLPTELEQELAASTPRDTANLPGQDIAEWATPIEGLDPARPADYAVARSGEAAGGPPRRFYLPEVVTEPAVSYRGVRSAQPLFRYEEMQ